jgi:hypothetical protein
LARGLSRLEEPVELADPVTAAVDVDDVDDAGGVERR